MSTIANERINHLRIAAGIAKAMPGSNTVHLAPHELETLLDAHAAHADAQAEAGALRCQLEARKRSGDALRLMLERSEHELRAVRDRLVPVIEDGATATTPELALAAAAAVERGRTGKFAGPQTNVTIDGDLADDSPRQRRARAEKTWERARAVDKPADPARFAAHAGKVDVSIDAEALKTTWFVPALSVDDVAIIAEALDYLQASTNRMVKRSESAFIPALAELCDQQQRLMDLFDGLLREVAA